MDINDLIALLSNANEEQKQAIREVVAPITKLQRLQQEATDLANRVNQAVVRVNDQVSRFSNKVQAGDLTAIAPSWNELVTLFYSEDSISNII